MHGFDFSVPFFSTRVRGTRIVVTPQFVADVLHVPRVEHLDYPGCECLRIVSKDEMISAFCERPADWGDCQFTPCKAFAKGPRFMNTVMTFVLHPLSHYNSIIEPRARFLLGLLEHLTINFPSHFILSILDVYRDTTTRDKLIFLFPFPFLTIFLSRVPQTTLPLNVARRSLGHSSRIQQLLPPVQLHPRLLLPLLWAI